MKRAEVVTCPACGVTMNRHAAKPIEARNPDPSGGGEAGEPVDVVDVYRCPRCGDGAARHRSGTSG